MKGRSLSADEAALWARVVQSVQPIAGRGTAISVSPAEVRKPADMPQTRESASQRPDVKAAKSAPKASANTLDGSWDRRLGRGLVQPDLAVDLHGHNLDTAYRTLDAGLDQAIANGARVLLLVTGKPRDPGSGRGAIRAAVGDWLAGSRHAADIAAVRGAHPRHGGSGALYIILKRRRESRTF